MRSKNLSAMSEAKKRVDKIWKVSFKRQNSRTMVINIYNLEDFLLIWIVRLPEQRTRS